MLTGASNSNRVRSTTVLCVRRNNKVVLASDGQVTMGDSIVKHGAKKVRRMYNEKIIAGFAGSTADAFSLFARFDSKLEQHQGNLRRSAVELAKDWPYDKILRHSKRCSSSPTTRRRSSSAATAISSSRMTA